LDDVKKMFLKEFLPDDPHEKEHNHVSFLVIPKDTADEKQSRETE
jgi:hypothetical protein